MKIELSLYCMKELTAAVDAAVAREALDEADVEPLTDAVWATLKPYLFGDRLEIEFRIVGYDVSGELRTVAR